MTPETRDRSDNADPPVPSDPPDPPERRVNPAAMGNRDLRDSKDRWANADRQACLVSREPKDTGDWAVPTGRRELRDNKDSPETSESQDPWVLPAQWVHAAQAVSVDASDPRAHRVSVAATAFRGQAALRVPSVPRVLQESPASPDPRETKDNKGPRVAAVFKVRAERTVCPDLPESPEFKERPVWTAPTERKVLAETWEFKEPRVSPVPEVLPVLPATPVWPVLRVFRANLEFLDFAV